MPVRTQPPITFRTHLSLLLLGLVYIFSYIDRQAIAILIEPIKREFGATDTMMGLLTGLAFGLLYAGLGVPVGKLADRANRRNIVAVCCTVWSLATMTCGVAQHFWQLLIARMTVAVGEAGGMAPSISMVSDMYPRRQRSLVISLFMMGPHFGVLIGLAVGGWIAQHHGWRAAFLWFGAPGVVLGLLVCLLVREPVRGGFDGPAEPPSAAAAATESLWAQLRRLLADPAFRHICWGCGIAGVAGYGYAIWTPSFLMRTHGLTLAQAGLLFGVVSGLAAVAGAIFSGWACDRLVRRDQRWQLGLPLVGVLIAVPMAFALFLWPAGPAWTLGTLKVPHAALFILGFGFFASWWPSLSYSAVSQMVPASERSTAAALLNLFITLFGVGAGPLVTGMLSDLLTPRFGSEALRWALFCALALMVLTAVAFALALAPYRRRMSAQTSAVA